MNTPANVSSKVDSREANIRFLKVLWRWTIVILGAWAVTVLIDRLIGKSTDGPLSIAATSTIAVTVFIAFFADIMGLLGKCRSFIEGRTDSLRELNEPFWKAWGSLTAIFIAIATLTDPPAPARPDPWYVIYSDKQPPQTRKLATVPVMYARSADHHKWIEGVSFSDQNVEINLMSLNRIISALLACGSVAGKPTVQVEIKGFASSKEFTDAKDIHESNEWNVEAANRRAWAAYCFARDKIGATLLNPDDWTGQHCKTSTRPAPQVGIHVNHWPQNDAGFEAMTAERQFIDRPDGIEELQRRLPEELTRRVDFNVIKAGACQKEPQIVPPNPLTASAPLARR